MKSLTDLSLMEDHSLSYGKLAQQESDHLGSLPFDNLLIQGENLGVMRRLLASFRGAINCIYLDPPYNTGSHAIAYDHSLEHTQWVEFMRERLRLAWELLTPKGLLAVQIDDNEFARLYLLMAELLGECNLKVICVKMAEPTGVKMRRVREFGGIAKLKEYVVLAKRGGVSGLALEQIPKQAWDPEYRLVMSGVPDSQIRRLRELLSCNPATKQAEAEADEIAARLQLQTLQQFAQAGAGCRATPQWCFDNAWRIIRSVASSRSAKRAADAKRATLAASKGQLLAAFAISTPQHRLYLCKFDYDSAMAQPRFRLIFAADHLTKHPGDFWDDIKTTGLGDEGQVTFLNGKKPEALLRRIIEMSTLPGDLVLDAFAGSGTTAAVAHKLRRRWIAIEQDAVAVTHCAERLRAVIDGTDRSGITAAAGWTGGGSFRLFHSA